MTHPAPPVKGLVARLRTDVREMWTYVTDMPWPAIRVFLLGALLVLIFKFFCVKKSFYKHSVRPVFDFDVEWFGLGRWGWLYLSTFFVFFLLAVAFARFADKLNYSEMGLGLGDWRFGLRWAAIFLGIMLPVVFAASFTGAFSNKYPLAHNAADSPQALLLWEFLAFIYFIGWEFYYRGYLLFGLYRHIGTVAIFVPMIPFVIMHSGKPLPEALGSILVAELLCVFALRAGSIWYGMVVHWLINVTMDITAIWQKGWFS